jgi:formiminoglutamate deiminase
MSLPTETRSIHAEVALLPDGWARDVRLEISNGRFSRLQRDASSQPGDEIVEVLLPGVANVHSHGFQRGMAGLTEYRGPDADNFWSWRELMYRFVGRMTPDDIEAITAMAYVEMLESGFTRVGEFHYVHHDRDGRVFANPAETAARVAAAAQHTGIALTLLPVFYAHSNFGGRPPTEGQRRFVTQPDQYAKLLDASRRIAASLPDARVGVAPHSLRAVTPEELQAVIALAGDRPIHIHAAEQVREVDDCKSWSGTTPVRWLLDHASLDERWCLVHATHLDDAEINGLARSGAVAGFCPVTEANLGDGIAPAAPFMAAGGTLGIGTDSNVSISVREELRQLEYAQRLRDRSRNVLGARGAHSTGRTLFAEAQRGGGQALGEYAGLAEGLGADCFSLARDQAPMPRDNDDALLDSFIFAPAPQVQHAWRGGRKVVSAGVHFARRAVRERYDHCLRGLLA